MIPPEKEEQIRLLLKEELPHRKIARIVGVNKGTVKAVGIRSRLQKHEGLFREFIRVEKYRCKTCGGMAITQPCFLCSNSWPVIIPSRKQISEALIVEIFELYRIARDISELHKLCLIPHPLFCTLACRAEKSLRRILDGTKIT